MFLRTCNCNNKRQSKSEHGLYCRMRWAIRTSKGGGGDKMSETDTKRKYKGNRKASTEETGIR